MMHVPDDVVAGLRSRLGPGRVFDDPDTLARRSLDTWPLPLVQQVVGREPPAPLCVVRPGSTDEVSRALAYLTGSGIPVAIKAVTHAQRLSLGYLVHLVDLAVAFNTTHTSVHMHGVVVIDEIGHSMDLDPGNRLARGIALPDQGQPGVGGQHLAVAVHAG